jgi:hypothetical protein
MNSRSTRIWKAMFYSLLAIDLGLLGEICWLNLAPPALAQTSSQYPELDKNGKPLMPRPGPQVVYSPTDLAHNAVTLPASGATAKPVTPDSVLALMPVATALADPPAGAPSGA